MDVYSTATLIETKQSQNLTLAKEGIISPEGSITCVHILRSKRLDSQTTGNQDMSGQTMAFGIATSITPTTSTVQEHDPGMPIPLNKRTRKKIWPHLAFPTTYHSRRFEIVTEHFKKAVDKHDRLQDVAHNINYHPAMVGHSSEEAKPSILVLCRQENVSDLMSLFDNEFLARIRCASHSRLRERLPAIISGPRTRTTAPLPEFWVYYYPSEANPTIRNAALDSDLAEVHLLSSITWCGALAEYNGRKATIGLTIEIDGILRLLTAEHLFDKRLPDTTTHSLEENEALWLYESDDSEDSYEFESISKGYYKPLNKTYSTSPVTPTEAHHGSSLAIPLSHTVGAPAEQSAKRDSQASPRESGRDYSKPTFVQGQRIESTVAPDQTSPYLDWAIMSVDEATSSSRRHNLIQGRQNTWIRLQAMISFPPTGITPVVMVSGINGVRNGEILHGMSYIGSRPGQQMCRAWTMLLTSPEGVFPGECGSIVVDQKSFAVYGHVVGSNHLGHAYVVPLSDTFDQIRTAFNTKNVGFPMLTREFRPALGSEHSIASSSISNDPFWESKIGSARNDTQDDRLAEVAYSRQERMLYASRLTGPPRPPTQRPSAADVVRAYERLYGGQQQQQQQQQQQHVTPPTVYYDDQFGTLPAASSYAQALPELEDFDTSNNSRRSESTRAKEHSSQQEHNSQQKHSRQQEHSSQQKHKRPRH